MEDNKDKIHFLYHFMNKNGKKKNPIYKPVAAALWCLKDHMLPAGHVLDNTGLDDNRCYAI